MRELLLNNARLPDAAAMREAIAERAAWYAAQYRQSLRHTSEEEHVRYLSDLKKSLKSMVKRRAHAPDSGTFARSDHGSAAHAIRVDRA